MASQLILTDERGVDFAQTYADVPNIGEHIVIEDQTSAGPPSRFEVVKVTRWFSGTSRTEVGRVHLKPGPVYVSMQTQPPTP